MIDPHPGGPEDRREKRFHMAGWNVDNQVLDATFSDRLQMRADGINMNAIHEFRTWLEKRPGLHNESLEAPSSLFGQDLLQGKSLPEKVGVWGVLR